ncbi:MAG: FkbM family methyltransferase [Anaerolineales bacterium]|nr:FkbM family methyltransferase [Anaerolineales bacterium]
MKPEIVSQEKLFNLVEIMGTRFFWPADYDTKGLASVYRDVFAPFEINPHAYESNKTRVLENEWLIDAGACEGFFSQYALSRGANVLLIEPVKKLVEALSLTYENEIKQGKIQILHGALGPENGTIDISIPDGGPIVASIDPCWTISKDWEFYEPDLGMTAKEKVQLFTIDEIVRQGIIPRVDYIKMDIENAEVGAILGAEKTLCSMKPKLSIAVYHDYYNARHIHSYIKKFNHNMLSIIVVYSTDPAMGHRDLSCCMGGHKSRWIFSRN